LIELEPGGISSTKHDHLADDTFVQFWKNIFAALLYWGTYIHHITLWLQTQREGFWLVQVQDATVSRTALIYAVANGKLAMPAPLHTSVCFTKSCLGVLNSIYLREPTT
jgi:hypothetical protein